MKFDTGSRPAGYSGVFAWPIGLAILGVIGLASALIGDGAWDALSWAALAAPIPIIIWHVIRAKRR
jgi:hypothetical protein